MTLRSEKFDIGVTEALSTHPLSLFYAIGIRTTFMTSPLPTVFYHKTALGIPPPSSFVQGTLRRRNSHILLGFNAFRPNCDDQRQWRSDDDMGTRAEHVLLVLPRLLPLSMASGAGMNCAHGRGAPGSTYA